jgi:hypothetical protein
MPPLMRKTLKRGKNDPKEAFLEANMAVAGVFIA